jgi:uroporphyrinogen-III synthase
VRNFAKIYGADQVADLLKNTVVATIGPVTADAARQLAIPVTIQPATYTIPALVGAIAAHYASAKSTKTNLNHEGHETHDESKTRRKSITS